jgi:predicted DCC family thiol-disulfide oxidoreductase YuxK
VSAGLSAIGLAYKMMLFLGLPMIFVLRRIGAFRSGPLETAFALLGGLPFLPIILGMLAELPDRSPIDWRDVSMPLIFLLIGTLSGLFAGRMVWFVAGEPLPEEEGAEVHHHLPAGEPREVIDLEAGPLPAMEDAALTVLYDVRCALCRQARSWLASQPKYVPMAFVPAGSREAWRRFPNLDHGSTLEELTVIGWQGEVYRGAKGWVMCLWALKKYRSASLRLSTPEMLPVARRLIAWVSRNRFQIGEAAGWTK